MMNPARSSLRCHHLSDATRKQLVRPSQCDRQEGRLNCIPSYKPMHSSWRSGFRRYSPTDADREGRPEVGKLIGILRILSHTIFQ